MKYCVNYRYYNYAAKRRIFNDYETACKFWNYMRRKPAIGYAEITQIAVEESNYATSTHV